MAPRKPRTPKAEKVEPNSTPFLEALKFIGIVTKDQGNINETHVFLGNSCAIAFNGILAAGIRISEEIYCCPHNKLLIQALSKCGDNLNITQLDNNRLAIKSGKFKAMVPCVDPSTMSLANPDYLQFELDDTFKESVAICNLIKPDEATRMITNSILVNGQSLISSDGKVIIEHWHGFQLPVGVVIPKAVADVLSKVNKKLIGLGFSNTSATFWFEGDCWIRTQLISDQWPPVSQILDSPSNPWPTPPDLFKALSAVAPFAGEEGLVHFDTGLLKTHTSEGAGATYEVHGLPKGPVFSIKQLSLLEKLATKIDFMAPGPYEGTTMLKFIGPNCRGGIAGRNG